MVCSLFDTFTNCGFMVIAVFEYQANAMLEANHVGMEKEIKIFDLDFD